MLKQGGVSWNQSPEARAGVTSRFKCPVCQRQYKMEWARNNHEKSCREFNKC